MQVDISESRSRAFNLFLRFAQLGISLIAAIECAKLDNDGCNTSFYKLIEACCIILTIISFFGNIYFRCRDGFHKNFFFVILALCIIVVGIILIVSFAGYGESNVCASNRISFRFMVIDIIAVVIINLLVLFASFYWIQRYSNSPGNITWTLMYLPLTWNPSYNSQMIAIGVLSLIISLITIAVNAIAAFNGITTLMKKIIVISWSVCLVIMLVI